MSAYPLSNKRTVRIVAIVNSLFFWIFSLIYLAVFQGDLMVFRAESLFEGRLDYHPWIGALAITGLLWLLRLLVDKVLRFGAKGYAFSYLPSFLILGGITFYAESYRFPLALGVFAGTVLLSLLFFAGWSREITKFTVLGTVNLNLQELLLLCCLTVAVGNTDENLHHELSMASAFGKGEYDKVLRIGDKSLSVSPKMAEYRICALSRTGQLADRLFEYPQPYTTLPILSEKSADVREVFDMSMVALLLNRDLEGFYREMGKARNSPNTLPRHYAEAMIFYRYLHPELLSVVDDKVSDANFKSFITFLSQLKSEKVTSLVEVNSMKREFGNTYWFYYLYDSNSVGNENTVLFYHKDHKD